METLTNEQIDRALQELDGWSRDGDAIAKSYDFDAFLDAIGFIDRLAQEADDADHHPEIRNVYTTVDLRLSTHSAGGITEKDLDLARRIDAVR